MHTILVKAKHHSLGGGETHWKVPIEYERIWNIGYIKDGDGAMGFAHNLVGYTDADFVGEKMITSRPPDGFSHSTVWWSPGHQRSRAS
jgi:beta-lactamase class D